MHLKVHLGVLAIAASLWVSSAAAQQPDTVWVHTRSGVYHCRGTRDYRLTTRGEVLVETDALRRGYRPKGGVRCPPLTAPTTGAPTTGASVESSTRDESDDTRRETPFDSRNDRAPSRPAATTRACSVARISDGDTIECPPVGRVRLIGIDTPESDQEPFGTSATAAFAAIVPLGATVQLEGDREATDRYGRALAYIWFDGRMVNWLLVRYGWGVSLRYPPNVRYAEQFEAAETRARAEARGLWVVNGFQCRPRDHRAHRC
ncbi:MAG: thermonuclease family protein [Gemmatimonadota bacterium]